MSSKANANGISKQPSTTSDTSSKTLKNTSNPLVTQIDRKTNRECLTFVWLDLRRDLSGNFVGCLRAINDFVRIFIDIKVCIDFIQSSNEKIFFISSSSDAELLNIANICVAVEAIFVFDPDTNNVRGDFSKLIDSFTQQEELLRMLRTTLNTFEHLQLEKFIFETDKIFLWWQLWKEEIISKKSKTNNKSDLLEQTRNYYRGNQKRLKLIDEFDKTYRPNDALQWCFRSSFPSRSLRYALMSPTIKLLFPYQFLITDAIHILQQQPKCISRGQVYRGMKITSELIDKFETHTGALVSVNGFFLCTKSRNNELQWAASQGYRSDLSSVLFKIDFDAATKFAEVTMEDGTNGIIFDLATSFRMLCVNRGVMTIIKMKTASDDGKMLAIDYKEKHTEKTTTMLLDELNELEDLSIKSKVLSTRVLSSKKNIEVSNALTDIGDSQTSKDELEANECLARGDIDRAIMIYRRIRPISVRVLKLMGKLLTDEKHEYGDAIECYRHALKIQEEGDKDIIDTLSKLATIYQHRAEYDLALDCHLRALSLCESAQSRDSNLIASCLTDISNFYRKQKRLGEALDYAQRAWTLYESFELNYETSVAKSLSLLTNIHHDLGDDAQALLVGMRAITILEKSRLSNLSELAELLNTLGLIQMNLGNLTESRHDFEKALKIYSEITPLNDIQTATISKNLQDVLKLEQHIEELQYYS